MEQRSPEWFAARCGRVTASRVSDLIARTKTGWGASRANYMAQLVAERLTGEVVPAYENEAMRWGTEKEPDARAAYEFMFDCQVEEVGFVDHPTIPMAGGSPDGLVSTDGMVEFKAPLTATHIETLRSQAIPGKYETQCLWNLACNPVRDWIDYVSFDPRMPENMSLFRRRIMRDDKRIAELEQMVRDFLTELDATVTELKAAYSRKAA